MREFPNGQPGAWKRLQGNLDCFLPGYTHDPNATLLRQQQWRSVAIVLPSCHPPLLKHDYILSQPIGNGTQNCGTYNIMSLMTKPAETILSFDHVNPRSSSVKVIACCHPINWDRSVYPFNSIVPAPKVGKILLHALHAEWFVLSSSITKCLYLCEEAKLGFAKPRRSDLTYIIKSKLLEISLTNFLAILQWAGLLDWRYSAHNHYSLELPIPEFPVEAASKNSAESVKALIWALRKQTLWLLLIKGQIVSLQKLVIVLLTRGSKSFIAEHTAGWLGCIYKAWV